MITGQTNSLFYIMQKASLRLHTALLYYANMYKNQDETWQEYAKRTPAKAVAISRLYNVRACGERTIKEFHRLVNE